MEHHQAVDALSALAHGHRLAIYRLLVRAGQGGLSAGTIAGTVGVSPSSLTFHVQSLQRAGLVTQARAGRQLMYAADFARMNGLVDYLTENCCGGARSCAPACRPVAQKPAATRKRRAA